MAPAKSKMFPRGGQLVSQGQKTSRVMTKVKKQQGKKNDLFAEKRVFKESITPALREKFKGRMKQQKEKEEMPQMVKENLNQVDLDAAMNEDDELPKYPINVTPKLIKPGTVALVAIRTVDQYGLCCNFPGGHTAYIRAQNISPQIEATCSSSTNNRLVCNESDLSEMYKPGEVVTAQVVYVNKRHKIDLTMRPEAVNGHLTKFGIGMRVQGIVSSIEDEGVIVDLGRGETSKGFISKGIRF